MGILSGGDESQNGVGSRKKGREKLVIARTDNSYNNSSVKRNEAVARAGRGSRGCIFLHKVILLKNH